MNRRFLLICFTAGLLAIGCKDSNLKKSVEEDVQETLIPETNHPDFVSNMEVAHQKSKLLEQGVICFNIDMTFGQRNSQMKIFTTPSSSAIRVDKKDGPSTVMINGDIYTDADSSSWRREKFGVYTYQYFFMAPFKFSDEGTKWEKLPNLEGEVLDRALLTFESGTGDAPDDWYIVHSDPETNLVNHIGYIVTGGGATVEEAEKNAHAIKYSDYQEVDGIPMARQWEFFDYQKDTGLGDKIGEAKIKNIAFMDAIDQFDIIHDGTYTKVE